MVYFYGVFFTSNLARTVRELSSRTVLGGFKILDFIAMKRRTVLLRRTVLFVLYLPGQILGYFNATY